MNNEPTIIDVHTDNRGFTIVELLVAFTLFAVLVVAITPVFKSGSDYWQTAQSQAELRQNLNSALQVMAREIRQADEDKVHPGVNGIITYYVNNELRSFTLEHDNHQPPRGYIVFHIGKADEPITSSSTVIVNTLPEVKDQGGGLYKITITGKYAGRSAIKDGDREMTVTTVVATRTGR